MVMRTNQRALVIGGSVAGLLAARVLAEHFGQVTILERDRLADERSERKGVPQGRHAHGVLLAGAACMRKWLPDLEPALAADGAAMVEMAQESRWFLGGTWLMQYPGHAYGWGVTRPLLEWRMRQLVLARPNVALLDGTSVIRLQTDSVGERMTGVWVQDEGGGEQRLLAADLVVDAGGRGSRLPQWLDDLGHGAPLESRVQVNLGYASRLFRPPVGQSFPWRALLVFDQPPGKRQGVIVPVEGDRWMVSLVGYHHDHPPIDDAGFLAFARGLGQPAVYEALKNAEPLTKIATFKVPAEVRRHYEGMANLPGGLIAMGDGVCAFNPVFGQGMSVASLEADLLDQHLRRSRPNLAGFSRRFQRALGKLVDVPWNMALAEDFRHAETVGPRPPGLKFQQWYTGRVMARCGYDLRTRKRFQAVAQMLRPPTALFDPGTVLRALLTSPAQAGAPLNRSASLPSGPAT